MFRQNWEIIYLLFRHPWYQDHFASTEIISRHDWKLQIHFRCQKKAFIASWIISILLAVKRVRRKRLPTVEHLIPVPKVSSDNQTRSQQGQAPSCLKVMGAGGLQECIVSSGGTLTIIKLPVEQFLIKCTFM